MNQPFLCYKLKTRGGADWPPPPCLGLKIISYNCNSLNFNAGIVKKLLDECQILCLQETLIGDHNSHNLDKLNNDFMHAYVPAYRKPGCFSGRSSGGLTIFWRDIKNFSFTPLKFDKRIMGLKITFPGGSSYLILNIYCICDYGTIDAFVEYNSTLATLDNIIKTETYSDLFIVGDFNADPLKGRFFGQLKNFYEENELIPSDIINLPAISYTFVSSNESSSTSFLDHVLCSNSEIISNHEILYGWSVYDHIPICFDITLPNDCHVQFVEHGLPSISDPHIDWDKATQEEINAYASTLESLCLEISPASFLCFKDLCHDENHINNLNELYSDILDCISVASMHLPYKKHLDANNRVVGWNSYCKEKYKLSREKFLIWHNKGKPRLGQDFENMKQARSAFKNALNYCKNNEMRIKKENIMSKFALANKSLFWQNVSKINGKYSDRMTCIDSKYDLKQITEIFDRKYQKILDDPKCQTGQTFQALNESGQFATPLITSKLVDYGINELNIGIDWNNLHANNLKFSGPIFRNLLCKFFNKLLDHSFLPSAMIFGEIRPVIKSNTLSKNNSENYRPVMNSAMMLKVFEYCLLPSLQAKLKLNNRQFGFRKETGCLPAITLVKETISKYNNANTPVHCALVDLSKAFDKVNKHVLFRKLYETDMNPKFIKILRCMYDNSFVRTKFNNFVGDSWQIGNGVRQGGILSPLLFSFYVDEIINLLTQLPVGCAIDGYKTNIICFADDMIIMAPSCRGLQILLDTLSGIAKKLCLTFNIDKSQYIIFKNGKSTGNSDPKVTLNNEQLKLATSCKYLGVYLNNKFNLNDDVDRIMNAFLRQFNGMFSKFSFLNFNARCFLFNSFCSSFYGMETWVETLREYQLKKISVAYHKAVKRVGGFEVWNSNHDACEAVGVLLFRHLWAKRLLFFWHRLCLSRSPCTANLRYYFASKSCLYAKIDALFSDKYDIKVALNPLCAINSRIYFVQKHEPRSYYVPELQLLDSQNA